MASAWIGKGCSIPALLRIAVRSSGTPSAAKVATGLSPVPFAEGAASSLGSGASSNVGVCVGAAELRVKRDMGLVPFVGKEEVVSGAVCADPGRGQRGRGCFDF